MSKPKPTNSELDSVNHYMAISLDWNNNIILPYKEGVALLATLEKAERIKKYYNNEKLQFNDDKFEMIIIIVSQAEYREQKMKKLLGVDDEEKPQST